MSATYCITKYNSSIISYLGEVEVVAFLISVWAGDGLKAHQNRYGQLLKWTCCCCWCCCLRWWYSQISCEKHFPLYLTFSTRAPLSLCTYQFENDWTTYLGRYLESKHNRVCNLLNDHSDEIESVSKQHTLNNVSNNKTKCAQRCRQLCLYDWV